MSNDIEIGSMLRVYYKPKGDKQPEGTTIVYLAIVLKVHAITCEYRVTEILRNPSDVYVAPTGACAMRAINGRSTMYFEYELIDAQGKRIDRRG